MKKSDLIKYRHISVLEGSRASLQKDINGLMEKYHNVTVDSSHSQVSDGYGKLYSTIIISFDNYREPSSLEMNGILFKKYSRLSYKMRGIYDALPKTFEREEGIAIAHELNASEDLFNSLKDYGLIGNHNSSFYKIYFDV